jgi:hypothetical protein
VPQRLLSDLPCDGWRLVFLREVLARLIVQESPPTAGDGTASSTTAL